MNEKKIIKEYLSGKSTHELAEKYDTYANKIRRLLIKNGVEIRSKSEAQSTALKTGRHKHPTKGTERDEETKLKISSSMVDYFSDISDEEREKRVNMMKERWYNMSEDERQNFIKMGNKAIRQSKIDGSKLEIIVMNALKENGYSPVFHDDNILPSRKLEVDINLPTLMIAIEVDGPSHFLPIWGEDKLKKQQGFDRDKNALLVNHKFKVIRVECVRDTIPLAVEKEFVDKLLAELKKTKKAEVVRITV